MSLNPRAIGLALATLTALFWLVAMGFSLLTGVGERTMTTLGSYHPFFSYAFTGLIAMIVEHLILGFILGWLFAKFYNYFLRVKQ